MSIYGEAKKEPISRRKKITVGLISGVSLAAFAVFIASGINDYRAFNEAMDFDAANQKKMDLIATDVNGQLDDCLSTEDVVSQPVHVSFESVIGAYINIDDVLVAQPDDSLSRVSSAYSKEDRTITISDSEKTYCTVEVPAEFAAATEGYQSAYSKYRQDK
jgi:hypothetical protein